MRSEVLFKVRTRQHWCQLLNIPVCSWSLVLGPTLILSKYEVGNISDTSPVLPQVPIPYQTTNTSARLILLQVIPAQYSRWYQCHTKWRSIYQSIAMHCQSNLSFPTLVFIAKSILRLRRYINWALIHRLVLILV